MASSLSIRRLSQSLARSGLPRSAPVASKRCWNVGAQFQRAWFSSFPPHEVVGLPSLSPTMESGSIASWNLKEGDTFSAGDVLCSVETDKATVDFEAQDDGFIAKILADAGPDEIQCGQPIVVTVEEEGDVAAFAKFTIDDAGGSPAVEAPASDAEPATPPPQITSTPAASTPSPSPALPSGGRVIASPLAHTLAREMGYNITQIPGTGPGGRIIAADVKEYVPGAGDAAVGSQSATAAATFSSETMLAGPPISGDGYTDYPISDAAQEIAARMAQSKRNVPHYYLTVDITMDNLLITRASLNNALGGGDNASLGVYEFLLKAAGVSMKAVPTANASWMDSVVRIYDSVDINVVVGSGDTLCTPVIRDCGKKGVKGISDELAGATAYLEDDDESSPPPPASEMGTFTIINVGMYGVKSCAPIIREPQACALALGALENRIVPNDDEDSEEMYKESVVMTATLSCDHRVIDGAVGAQWLSAFKSYVESPSTLLL